jgi:Phosphotransferase enzyme family
LIFSAAAAYCLFSLATAATITPEPSLCEVAASCEDHQVVPSACVWFPVSALEPNLFVRKEEYAVVLAALDQTRSYQNGVAFGPFGKPGWVEELLSWARQAITPLGLTLNGKFLQLNAGPAFALVRLETNGPALWFKAVGEPNLREFPITLALPQFLGNYVPPVLATRPEWNGWLSQEVEGVNVGETRDIQPWVAASAALAKWQIESTGKSVQLLTSGARDLRSPALARALSPFLNTVSRLMEEQSKVPPPVLKRNQVLLLEEHLQEALSLTEASGIPDALGHRDLNPGNIIVSPTGCVFLDWTEAYVGNPFFSFQYLLEHFRRLVGEDPSSEAQLAAAYIAPWQALVSPYAVESALTVAPLLAVFAYAVGSDAWTDLDNPCYPNAARYLRSLARRMNREARLVMQWRSPCPS